MPKPSRPHMRVAVLNPQTEWSRRKLQVLLGVIVAVVLTLAAGAVWSVTNVLTRGSLTSEKPSTPGTSQQSPQDQLASKPLPTTRLEAAQPGSLSSAQTGTLRVPAPMAVGPAGVASGFPHTPQGALAQLAAIDTAALTSASVRLTQEVISNWAAPGGPTARNWSGVRAVAGLLESAGLPSDASGAIRVDAEPEMGFIKGTVGEDFAVPCIDFIVTATTTATTTATDGRSHQVAVADCQRMVWQSNDTDDTAPEGAPGGVTGGAAGGRWVIGPGDEPAGAPSVWPGSQESFDAGYRWLEVPQ